jgi:hypothetical protein
VWADKQQNPSVTRWDSGKHGAFADAQELAIEKMSNLRGVELDRLGQAPRRLRGQGDGGAEEDADRKDQLVATCAALDAYI